MLREIPRFIPFHQKRLYFLLQLDLEKGKEVLYLIHYLKNIYQNFEYINGDLNIEANDHKHQKIKIFKNN